MTMLRSTEQPEGTVEGTAAEVLKLWTAGLTVRKIAKVLDLSTQGIYWHLKKLDLPPNKEVAS